MAGDLPTAESGELFRMKTTPRLLGVLLIAGFASSCTTIGERGGGTVEVNFQAPDQFTDLNSTSSAARGADEAYLQELREYVERIGASRIPAGHTLALTITDVDMAGRFEPEQGPDLNDVRIIRSVYPPRIDLTYRLTGPSGAVVSEGQRQLRNMAFDWTASPQDRNNPLRHEKELLDDFLGDIAREVR